MVVGMSDYRHKRHNVSSLLYHIVCPAKYRRVIVDAEIDTVLKDICFDIAKRYEIAFLEIGTDKDHVHFLVQSVPSYRPTKIVKIGYPLKAGQLTYDCRYSTMHGMPVTGGRGFRGLKPLWYNGVPP